MHGLKSHAGLGGKDICTFGNHAFRLEAAAKALAIRRIEIGAIAEVIFEFVYWYLMSFAGESPFSFSPLDVKTYAMALLKKDYRKSTKGGMPNHWFDAHPHTHIALDDVIEQGALFCNMLAENLGHNAPIVRS